MSTYTSYKPTTTYTPGSYRPAYQPSTPLSGTAQSSSGAYVSTSQTARPQPITTTNNSTTAPTSYTPTSYTPTSYTPKAYTPSYVPSATARPANIQTTNIPTISSAATTPLTGAYKPYQPSYYTSASAGLSNVQSPATPQVDILATREPFNGELGNSEEYAKLLEDLKRTKTVYRDSDFPANIQSLTGGDAKRAREWTLVHWRNPQEFWGPDHAVFIGGIEPNDIKQGSLGDCYFLCTLSSLAENPNRISKLFPSTEANAQGCYMVKVCITGVWREIIVDDLFPCVNRRSGPIFTKGNSSELWVLLLEKVWAKIYGSYARINSGLTREVLHDLTGAPTEYFDMEFDDVEEVWKSLERADEMNYAMTAGSGDLTGNGRDDASKSGLVGSHAYSLLAAKTVKTRNGPARLIQLRNPWGKTEWNGEWSDNSPFWTDDLKKQVKWTEEDDGTFFMGYKDFCKTFTDVQICRVHDDYQYSSNKITVSAKHAVYFKFTVKTPGHYYITVNQKSKRFFKDSDKYEYSDVNLVLAKETANGQYEYVDGSQDTDREVWTDGTLTAGNYIAYVRVHWYDQKDRSACISAYGYDTIDFIDVPKDTVPNFLEKVYMNRAENSGRMKNYQAKGEPNVFMCEERTKDGLGYFYFSNKGQNILNTEVKIMSGYDKLKKPYTGKTFKISVAPGEKKIVFALVSPYNESKVLYIENASFQRR